MIRDHKTATYRFERSSVGVISRIPYPMSNVYVAALKVSVMCHFPFKALSFNFISSWSILKSNDGGLIKSYKDLVQAFYAMLCDLR